MPNFRFCIFAAVLALASAHADEAEWFADKERLFLPLLASPRDPQIKISFLANDDGKFFEPAFGGDLGIYYKKLDAEAEFLTLMARVSVVPRFEFGSGSFDLWNTDFVGGPELTYKWGANGLAMWAFHESSHKGPDVAIRTGVGINYSYEAVRLLYSRLVRPDLRFYGGVETVVRGDPRFIRFTSSLRAGGDWHLTFFLPRAYLALDLEAKEIHGWTVNTAFQVGYELGKGESAQRRQHLFVNFYHGYSPQGQFYKERETAISAGIGMTF